MKGYLAFTKKEIMENTRNYKLLSILALFLFFGFLSPLSAMFMPELIASLAPELEMTVVTPSAIDSWIQFYKNNGGLGMSLMIIIFASMLSSEYSKGTLVIMLTKGLSRPAVLLSKFTVSLLIMTFSYWIGFLVSFAYTAFFWPSESLPNVVFAAFSLWLMGAMYLAIIILGGVLFRQAFANILFLLGITTVMFLLSIPTKLSKYSPIFLATKNVDLISGVVNRTAFLAPSIVTLIIIMICLVASIILFRKKQL